jgi:hypothetical protein
MSQRRQHASTEQQSQARLRWRRAFDNNERNHATAPTKIQIKATHAREEQKPGMGVESINGPA